MYLCMYENANEYTNEYIQVYYLHMHTHQILLTEEKPCISHYIALPCHPFGGDHGATMFFRRLYWVFSDQTTGS